MASSASTLSKIELQGAGDNPGTWHTYLNDALQQHEEDFRGTASIALSNTDVTLTDTQYVSNQARQGTIILTGTATGSHAIIAPDRKKIYHVDMQGDPGAFTITFKPSGGTGVTLSKGYRYVIYLNGSGNAYILAQSDPPFVTLSGTDTYTGSLPRVLAAYYAGLEVDVKFTNANTGAATVNFNAIGAVDLRKDANTALIANDISAGMTAKLIHDGTNFKIFVPKIAATLGLSDGGVKTTGFTAVVNTKYTAAFTANGTITLPASANAGDVIYLGLGGFYAYTLNPNGLKINSSTASLVVTGNQSFFLTYTSATDGWG